MCLGHPITDIDKEINRLELEIKCLKEEKSSRESLPEDKRLAIILHDKFCRLDHAEKCGWRLDKAFFPDRYWEVSGVHSRYLEKAREMLRERKFEDIVTILRLL